MKKPNKNNLHYALQLGFTVKLMMFTVIQKINPQQDKHYFKNRVFRLQERKRYKLYNRVFRLQN